jgi:flagellar motor component MotA
MTSNPAHAKPTSGKKTKTPDFLITWKESQSWLKMGYRKISTTEPWWAVPGMFVVSAGAVQFVQATFLQRVLVVIMAMLGGVIFNSVASYTSPSIISLYPTYLRQARGQSILRLDYDSIDHFKWTNMKGIWVLEVIGKEGWVVPISLRSEEMKPKIEAVLRQLSMKIGD